MTELLTPAVLIDLRRLDANIDRMQEICDTSGVGLWPHIKTHKMIEVAKRQLAAGARGLTCAKIGEAEAMLPSGVRSIFIAHSLVGALNAPRIQRLARSLDQLIVACTSAAHAVAIEALLAEADCVLPVMMAFDTGLGREGARGVQDAVALARAVVEKPHLRLHGIYTHEGQLYGVPPKASDAAIEDIHQTLVNARRAICDELNLAQLELWPGCSVSAARMATYDEVDAVRPGAYVFGDLALSESTGVMAPNDMSLTVLATVIDRPEAGLALIDAGSKVFSSDKTADGIAARSADGRDIAVVRCNEEHGYLRGADVESLEIGERLSFVPAHVCSVVNLTDWVSVLRAGKVVDTWRVDARGKVQ